MIEAGAYLFCRYDTWFKKCKLNSTGNLAIPFRNPPGGRVKFESLNIKGSALGNTLPLGQRKLAYKPCLSGGSYSHVYWNEWGTENGNKFSF